MSTIISGIPRKGTKKATITVEVAEDWCFVCKDGGELRICDYKHCVKSYHADCVGKEDTFLENEDRWCCDWHYCMRCRRSSRHRCYTCTTAVCQYCLKNTDFLPIKEAFGFCDECLKLVRLIEEDRSCDSDRETMDFTDRETVEGLFVEYYLFIKDREGFKTSDRHAAENRRNYKLKRKSWSDDEEDVFEGDSLTNGHKKSCFAAIVVENMKLVHLKRILLNELLMAHNKESFIEKVTGSFVRIKSNPNDCATRNPHCQLVQVIGVKEVTNGEETILLLSTTPHEISINLLAYGDITKQECEELRLKMLAGEIKRPTVGELQMKAKVLHKDITHYNIKKELNLLKNLIEHANEKGRRRQLYEYFERRDRLKSPSEQAMLLEEVPTVIPDYSSDLECPSPS